MQEEITFGITLVHEGLDDKQKTYKREEREDHNVEKGVSLKVESTHSLWEEDVSD